MVSERCRGIKYAIRDVVVPAKELEAQGHEVIHLNIGDPCRYDFDTPQHIRDAACAAINSRKNYYGPSEGEGEILASVREWERRVSGSEADSYLLTEGASEGVRFSCTALMGPGDEALVPSPNYPQYLAVPRLVGGTPVEYACLEAEDWQPDVDDVRKKISERTRLLVVINPNNPTGAVYSKKTLQSLIDVAGEHSIPIVSDEIYNLLSFGKHTPLVSLVKDTPVVSLNGISKSFLSPGWRVGFMGFRNCPDLYEACVGMARTRLSVNTPCAWGYKAALDGPTDFLEAAKKKLLARRDFVLKRFAEIGLECVRPESAFYAFPRIDAEDDKKWVLGLLKEEKVLVVHGSGFGSCGKGHFRMVYLAPLDVLGRALDGIERFVKRNK